MKYIAEFQARFELEFTIEGKDEPVEIEELKKRAESALSEITLETLGEQEWNYICARRKKEKK